MKRQAIDSSGRIGLHYDARRDRVIEVSSIDFSEKRMQSSVQPKCRLTNGNTEESNNLLQWMDFDEELRLSLLLRISKRSGISAVLDYSYPIDRYTRFLYYRRIFHELHLQTPGKFSESNLMASPHLQDTHIITGMKVGIDALLVLQLPSDTGIATQVDLILHQIRDSLLLDERNNSYVSPSEQKLLNCILRTTVYSNIPGLVSFNKIFPFLQCIESLKKTITSCRPISYILQFNTIFYPTHLIKTVSFGFLPADLRNNIEHRMIEIRNKLKYIDALLKEEASKVQNKTRQDFLNEIRPRFVKIKDKHTDEMQRFARLIIDVRGDSMGSEQIQRALHENEKIIPQIDLDELIEQLQHFRTKNSYSPRSSSACKVSHLSPNSAAKDQDRLVVRPNSAGPSSSSSNLKEIDHADCSPKLSALSITDDLQIPSFSSSVPTEQFINILLLGQTGAGKSTFINTVANHRTFSSFEHAQSNEPVPIISSAFTITIGDHFEECRVISGEIDNEQLTTQHCRSYVFDLKDDEKKLRIIDTPGWDDSRSSEGDDRIMEDIHSRIYHSSNTSQCDLFLF